MRISGLPWNHLCRLAGMSKLVSHTQAGQPALSPRGADRRAWLSKLSALPALGMLAKGSSEAQSRPEVQPVSPQFREKPVVATATPGAELASPEEQPFARDIWNFNRLKAVKLDDPKAIARRKQMPTGKIGDVSISRLICGSNLIGMNMHSRDLPYVQDLAVQYGSIERIWMTLKMLEERGVSTFNLKANNFSRFQLQKYRSEYGGKIQWIADVIAGTDIDRFEPVLIEHLKLEPAAVYLWGGSSDQWYFRKQERNIVKAYEIMRKYGIPVGIGAHRIEPVMFSEKEGLKPDFYFLTFHHDKYWSAHPKENRRPLEMFEPNSPDRLSYHDNLFCVDAERTRDFMQDVKVPWIAFKVMAAGAITPEEGFKYAFQNGADFICAGMFDWQVDTDVQIAIRTVEEAGQRRRPWRA